MIRELGRKVLSFFRKKRLVEIVPFDTLFPGVEKIWIVPPQEVPTPEAVDMEFVPGVAHYRQPVYRTPGVFAAILHDVLYCPANNVILTEQGQVLAESISTIPRPEYLDHYALSARRIERIRGPAAALRSVHNQFYHALIDNPPRLWALGHPALAHLGAIELLLRDGPTPLEQYILRGLRPPNVVVRRLKRRRLYRIDTFVFVSFMNRRHAACLDPVYLEAFRRAFCPDRPRRPRHRIYISRAGRTRGTRRVLNEPEVVAELERWGFRAYLLEDLSFEAQAELFYDAEMVVGAHGAGFANLIYARGAKVLEWFPSPHVVPSYYFLCKATGNLYFRRHASESWRDRDFVIDLDVLRRALDEMTNSQRHGG